MPITNAIEQDDDNTVNGFEPLGYAPIPSGKWQTLKSNIGHGLVMQFPIWKVLGWSLLNTFFGGVDRKYPEHLIMWNENTAEYEVINGD